MHSAKRVVARGDTGDLPASHDSSPRSAAVVQAEKASAVEHDDPRGMHHRGRRLSARVDAGDAPVRPRSSEPGAENKNRQLGRVFKEFASAVQDGVLRELAEAQIRRECRKVNFDWQALVEGRPEWRIIGIVHPRAVREGRRSGLDLRPRDIATERVLEVVRSVIDEWTDQPGLRPTYEGFCEEQGRRGEQGRETQAEKARRNEKRVMALVAEGETSDSVIAVRLELDRSTVYRIRRKAAAGAAVAALQVTADAVEPAAFPDPEMPPAERWPVTQFIRRTGAALGVGDARHLADVARCYEAEGRADELVDVIDRSASAEVRDPWAYLQRCITNRGDAWTVTPQLLGDVLTWGGEKALEYSLLAIVGGQVRRPLPYLRRVVATAVGEGRGKVLVIDRPVAMAVAMSARLAPELQVVGADDAVAAEDADVRTRHVESYCRRRGRLPWEDQEEGSKCCIGLKKSEDDVNLNLSGNINSSGESPKAEATAAFDRRETSPARGGEKLERPENAAEGGRDRCAGSHGEAGKQGQGDVSAVLWQNGAEVLEHGPCRHPVVPLLTARMVLGDIAEVECSARGCDHWLHSDRGPVECPCHWPAVKVAGFTRALRFHQNPRAN